MEPILIVEIKELPIDKQIEALEGIDWSVLEGRASISKPDDWLFIDAPDYGLCHMLASLFRVQTHNFIPSFIDYKDLAVLIPTFNRAKAIEFLRANYPNDFYLARLNSYWFSRTAGGDKQRKEFIEYLIKDLKAKQNGR